MSAMTPLMDCRPGCGACCIAPSITSPLPGMPDGKPAGVRCVNLDVNHRCGVWNTPLYPQVCRDFLPEKMACGSDREEALVLLTVMERETGCDKRLQDIDL